MHVSDVQKKGEKRRKRAQYGCRSLSVGMTEQCRQQTTFTLTPTLRADGELCERSPIREQPKLQYGEGGGGHSKFNTRFFVYDSERCACLQQQQQSQELRMRI